MAVEVILPRVDMDMVQAKISKWHVKEGDAVKAGAALFEIETDKAAMEIEAPASGIVGNITGKIVRSRFFLGFHVGLIFRDDHPAV